MHLKESGGGPTYAQLSTKARANPDDTKLQEQVATSFRGETLPGLLLNAYAFDTMGRIAGVGAIGAFSGAGVMLVLSLLGFAHLRRVAPEQEVLPRLRARRAPVTA